MEENASQLPLPNELVIPDGHVYTLTDVGTYQVIEYLLTKLEPVALEDLDPDDRCCAICYMEFCVSEDFKLSHPPVKTVCGHIFGKYCIIKWFDPLSHWGKKEHVELLASQMDAELERTNKGCPICRKVFFPTEPLRDDEMFALVARLWLWDLAYEFAGIARSEIEESSREHLWEFVNYCRPINEFKLTDDSKKELLLWAQSFLVEYVAWLKTQALTAVQKKLRKRLAKVAECDMDILLDGGLQARFPHGQEDESEDDEEDDQPNQEH